MVCCFFHKRLRVLFALSVVFERTRKSDRIRAANRPIQPSRPGAPAASGMSFIFQCRFRKGPAAMIIARSAAFGSDSTARLPRLTKPRYAALSNWKILQPGTGAVRPRPRSAAHLGPDWG